MIHGNENKIKTRFIQKKIWIIEQGYDITLTFYLLITYLYIELIKNKRNCDEVWQSIIIGNPFYTLPDLKLIFEFLVIYRNRLYHWIC